MVHHRDRISPVGDRGSKGFFSGKDSWDSSDVVQTPYFRISRPGLPDLSNVRGSPGIRCPGLGSRQGFQSRTRQAQPAPALLTLSRHRSGTATRAIRCRESPPNSAIEVFFFFFCVKSGQGLPQWRRRQSRPVLASKGKRGEKHASAHVETDAFARHRASVSRWPFRRERPVGPPVLFVA
ncbi:hypothetical protein LX36DRAFT_664593 [Colletotrichum falcatum]|nr:hypothetical protein LX36DRAFT_664593 [Colletotrichum falcatum]